MKATGIVRRIDELGRIVIPKEIRKTLRLREGENLEIYTDSDDKIILKKYSLMNKLEDFSQVFTDSIYTFLKHNIIITDTDKIIAASGELKKEFLGNKISDDLENHIMRRDTMLESFQKEIKITDDDAYQGSYAMSTIIASGDAVGLVFIFSEQDRLSEVEKKIAEITANFLAKHLEN